MQNQADKTEQKSAQPQALRDIFAHIEKIRRENGVVATYLSEKAGLGRGRYAQFKNNPEGFNYAHAWALMQVLGGNIVAVVMEPLRRDLAVLLMGRGKRFYDDIIGECMNYWKSANDDLTQRQVLTPYPCLTNYMNAAHFDLGEKALTIITPDNVVITVNYCNDKQKAVDWMHICAMRKMPQQERR